MLNLLFYYCQPSCYTYLDFFSDRPCHLMTQSHISMHRFMVFLTTVIYHDYKSIKGNRRHHENVQTDRWTFNISYIGTFFQCLLVFNGRGQAVQIQFFAQSHSSPQVSFFFQQSKNCNLTEYNNICVPSFFTFGLLLSYILLTYPCMEHVFPFMY